MTKADLLSLPHHEYCDGCGAAFHEADLSYLTPEGMEEGFFLCPRCSRIDRMPDREWIDDLMSTNEEDSR